MLLDIIETVLPGSRTVNGLPTVRDLCEGWPQRVLPLVIDKHKESTVFVIERIRHIRHTCQSKEAQGCLVICGTTVLHQRPVWAPKTIIITQAVNMTGPAHCNRF